jgi:hypothetical protein
LIEGKIIGKTFYSPYHPKLMSNPVKEIHQGLRAGFLDLKNAVCILGALTY